MLTATGTSSNEVITVYQNTISGSDYIVVKIQVVGGSSETSSNYSVATVTRVDVYGGAGDDSIMVESTTAGNRTFGDVEVGEVTNLYGEAGTDTIDAGKMGDTVVGGSGADTIRGWDGNDVLKGDVASTTTSSSGNATGSEDTIYGNAGSDTLYGQTSGDTLYGGSGTNDDSGGNDTLWGDFVSTSVGAITEASDVINGDGGNDTIYGDSRNVSLYNGLGDDTLRGDDGNDTIWGEADTTSGYGSDDIAGGLGNDTAYGGYGYDLFRMSGDQFFGFADYVDGGGISGDDNPLSQFDGNDTQANL